MADLSLDDYIRKGSTKFVKNRNTRNPRGGGKIRLGSKTPPPGGKKSGLNQRRRSLSAGSNDKKAQRGGAHSRLGFTPKKSPGNRPRTGFSPKKSPGQPKILDARQKIALKKRAQLTDARDKIIEKKKLVDARVRIDNSLAKRGIKTHKADDTKVTISGRNTPQQTIVKPKVTLSGFSGSREFGSREQRDGNNFGNVAFKRTINNSSVTRTFNNPSRSPEPRRRSPLFSRAMREQQNRGHQLDMDMEIDDSPPPALMSNRGPTIRIQNDSYQTKTHQSILKSPRLQLQSEANIISPLQGFKILVTNLHPVVTQEDIVELFSAIGALKKAKLLKKGVAEVTFVKREDAIKSVEKYNSRELDGMPMTVKLVTPASSVVANTGSELTPGVKLPTSSNPGAKDPIDLDIGVVHKALFQIPSKNNEVPQTRGGVTFTIKV